MTLAPTPGVKFYTDELRALDTKLAWPLPSSNGLQPAEIVVEDPFMLLDGDVLRIDHPRTMLDRLFRRPVLPSELLKVIIAGNMTTLVQRGFGGSPIGVWQRGDSVTIVGHIS